MRASRRKIEGRRPPRPTRCATQPAISRWSTTRASAKDPLPPDAVGAPAPAPPLPGEATDIRIPHVQRARERVRDRFYERGDVQQALIDALIEDLVRA